jgi:hypothetical protein
VQLEPVLEKLITYEFDPAVRVLLFEVFPESFTSRFPVRLFFYDARWTEHFILVNGRWQHPCEVDPDLLDIKQVYDVRLEKDFASEVDDPWSIAVDTLIEWFSQCWQDARGRRCKLPAYISQHDSSNLFDLRQKRWSTLADVDLS